MKSIRGEKQKFNGTVNGETEAGKGTEYEMIAEFSDFSDDFGLKLRTGENSETVIKFDYKEKKLILDRSRGEQPDKKPRKVYLGDIEKLDLRIFVDNSSVEVFVNGGKEVSVPEFSLRKM